MRILAQDDPVMLQAESASGLVIQGKFRVSCNFFSIFFCVALAKYPFRSALESAPPLK